MSSLIWYIYEFARKTWIDGFFDAKSKEDIAHKPDRFRDFPNVIKENCIGCGSCTASCPSPNAIKLVRDSDNEEKQSWAEQAKMRANKTATTYNNFILENSFVWSGNVPEDIDQKLECIE